MPDEIPATPSESFNDLAKSETIRITLPPKNEQPAVKRETVRINVPSETKVPNIAPAGGTPPPAPPKPFVPPPPGAGSPPPGLRPLSGATPPPKPPDLGASKPATVPLKPTMAPVSTDAAQRSATPKKETARITLPVEGAKQLPKATVRMQQTQPLVSRPAPALTSSLTQQSSAQVVVAADSAVDKIAIAALVLSIASIVTAYLAYAGAAAVIQ